MRAQLFEQAFVLHDVGLVRDDDLRAGGKVGGILRELCVDGVKVLDRVAALAARHVDDMNEQAAAVDMAQEVVTKARALGCALDDAGDVGHDERNALVDVHDAEVGVERGEVVVCDLGARLRHNGKKRRLADIREADEADVGQQLQLEHDIVLLALKARFGKTGRLTRRRCEVRVAPAALAAAAEDERLGVGHILDDLVRFRVAHDGAARHADREILALLAELARALTVHAVVGDVFALVAKVHQRGHVVVDNEDDVAAVAAVAAVGAARGDVLFAVERHRAIAALARAAEDARLINKRCCHVGTSLDSCYS